MSKKIVHLVPCDGIGGVETAVRSIGKVKRDGIDFEVDFIFKMVSTAHARHRRTTFNPLVLLSTARRVTVGKVDVLIVSLWWAAIVGILAKCLMPRLKLVVFIHDTVDAHWLDFLFTRLAMRLAHEVWADSQASLRERFPYLAPGKCRVISFVTRRFEALPAREVSPDFIFWGRIHAKKGLDRALRIFAVVLRENPAARFWIIGPDDGVLLSTQEQCKSLGLTDKIFFLGAAPLDEIAHHARKATFYLQTSKFEGMAMSVVEAMQMGLVPLVTPVGEIPSYCSHGVNALIIKTDLQAAENVGDLLSRNEEYQSMRLNAIATWKDAPLYAESVLHACEELLADNKKLV
jgi:glycosyltransferase involved in cell wall biosynthesis